MLASVRRAAMASSSFTRCPIEATPSSFRVSCVRPGRTVSSMSFSRNAASYFPRPRLRNQTITSMTAPLLRVAGHHRLSDPACPAQHPKQPSLLRELIHVVVYTLPVELGSLSPLLGRAVNAAAARATSRALVSERATNRSGCCAHKASYIWYASYTVFRKATAPFSSAP
jgi:hypothetical protein